MCVIVLHDIISLKSLKIKIFWHFFNLATLGILFGFSCNLINVYPLLRYYCYIILIIINNNCRILILRNFEVLRIPSFETSNILMPIIKLWSRSFWSKSSALHSLRKSSLSSHVNMLAKRTHFAWVQMRIFIRVFLHSLSFSLPSGIPVSAIPSADCGRSSRGKEAIIPKGRKEK